MTIPSKYAHRRGNQTHIMVLLAMSFAFVVAATALVAAQMGYLTFPSGEPAPRQKVVQQLGDPHLPLPAALTPQATTPSDPTQIRPLDRSDAQVWNAANPISTLPLARAAPFRLNVHDTVDWDRAVDCLTAAVYYEAAIEPVEGQRAVAQVVLNRVRHPAYPHTVCGVVFQGSARSTGCQFTFSCDGALRRTPAPALWARARSIAVAAIAGYVYPPVGLATHYHTNWIVPYWATSLVKLADVGTHIFYRWDGGWGQPRAFSIAYRGAEPAVAWRGGFGQSGTELAAILGTVDPIADGVTPPLPTERPALGIAKPATAGNDSAAAAPGPTEPGTRVATGQRWVLRGMPGSPAAPAPAPASPVVETKPAPPKPADTPAKK